MTKVLYIIAAVAVLAVGATVYWLNLSECMTEFSTLYCVTQVQ